MAPKILIVDDEPDILTIMKKALVDYDVMAFSDSRAAYNSIKNNPTEYSILISDVRMPGMTGFELIREARKINGDLKTILMTMFEIHIEELRKTLPSTKVDMVLPKPFQLNQLQSMVGELVARVNGSDTGGKPE